MGMTFEEARHFLARTGFGGTPDEIRKLTEGDRNSAVEQVLSKTLQTASTPAPSWVDSRPPHPRARKAMSPEEKKAFKKERRKKGMEMKAWWFQEMMATSSPLTERMTLFWHNHFTSSLRKVKWAPLLFRQNVLFRRMALGSFRDLLGAIAKDPAMILYLDTQTNNKSHPNENFARELFELFTLGEGHYTEQDIKEAARAFTGWKLNRRDGSFRIARRQHDHGTKTVLGKTGRLTGDDILAIALDQPSTATHIIKKLWREFISDHPDPQKVDRLARVFRQSDYHMKPVLTAMLTLPQFWASENRGVLIKSPVELMVSTIRLFDLPISDSRMLPRYSRRLGQDLFDPPNVKGWPGGTRWITTNSLLDRWQLLQRGLRGHEMGGHKHRMTSMMNSHEPTWIKEANLEDIQTVLLPLKPVQAVSDGEERWQAIRDLVLDPTYQLK